MPPDVPSLATAPRLTVADAELIAREVFGVTGRGVELPSERDQNFRLTSDEGARFVLKVANAAERRSMLEAENGCMHHLAATGLAPTPMPARDGSEIAQHGGHLVRLITWIDGQPLGDAPSRPDALLTDLGRVVGRVDRTLVSYDHPALHRTFHWDLAHAPNIVERHLDSTDTTLRPLIASMLAVHRDTVVPLLPSLRRSAIHGDANDYNVLVSFDASATGPHAPGADAPAPRVTGLVDFGDMVFSHTVNDLAIAMAYAALGQPDPLAAAGRVAAGYHAINPLTDDELAALFGLMALRLCLSVCVAAAQQSEDPHRDYLGISQAPIRRTLPTLAAIHPRLAHYRLREACGLAPVPHSPRVVAWLRANGNRIAPLTGHDLRITPVRGLDLSAGSPLVASSAADNTAAPFTRRVFAAMHEAGAEIGVGGYDEARLIYATDAFSSGTVTDERRTVHLGIDVTMAPGSPLYAPLDGVVHGLENARTRLDYGPVIVLRHEIPADDSGAGPVSFFTLYGHLDRRSLEGVAVGQQIRAGEQFATIGAPPDNGDWWPHVHFQIITDMLDVPCNFNGVAPASQRRTWLSLSPDANLLLGIPPERFARHLTTDALLAMRQQHFGGNVRLSYGDAPLQIVRGSMQYLFDETGRTYIDAYNNVPHVGHAHPRVTAAVAAQLATLNTNTRYLHETAVTYAAELAARFPPQLEVCFFTASGSEANELALRLARAYTGRRDLVVMDAAYHGHTTTLIDISPYKHAGAGGAGAPGWVHTSPIPDVYRGAYRDATAGLKYAREVGAVIEAIGDRGLCGFIAETCPSVAGQIALPLRFLSEVYRLVRAAGGVCIADEVQTGFGRMGTHFWAFEAHDVVPEIVVLGKPIANGYPMGAVVTTRAIAERFDNGMEFFSTFGGSTAACAAALATLRTTLEERLQSHALQVGGHLLSRLRELQQQHDLIGDVRGSGLFVGVELVRDRDTLTPATAEASAIVSRMRELGVLVGTDGPFHNVIKIRGPMPLTVDDVECIVNALGRALNERRT